MKRKFGYEALRASVLEAADARLEMAKALAPGDTEIEKLFACALFAQIRFGDGGFENLMVARSGEQFQGLVSSGDCQNCLIIRPQHQRPNWRVDFVVSAFGSDKWHDLVVECDGHDFHERTKEQAAKDRSRDRSAQLSGLAVFRFTGSELWRDPWACADQIISWAVGVQQ